MPSAGPSSIDGAPQPFDESRRAQAAETFQKLSADGFRTLGVAVRKVEQQDAYALAAEQEMTLAGFAAFLDPPKEGILAVLEALNKNGVSVVIMTGDNQYVTQKVAHDVGLATDRIVTGNQVDTMDDAALAYQAEHGAIFARVSPEQKNRVILGLKARGHVVGYIGDGINDAPSLHTADVGISVMNGVDVAKDAAKIILLEKDLAVLNEGVIEGRRCFANIMKYIIMSTSSNFGNMFSMAAASLFLPFLPMLPTQILLNNFLYDTSQVAVPGDNVDPALLHKPKRWQIAFIRQFMTIIGPISSLYDFLTFGVLLWLFHASTNAPLFRTGWFVESLATQTLVVFVIRTAGNPFRSRPSGRLLIGVVAVSVAGAVLPYTRLGAVLGFIPLPLSLLGAISLLALTYLILVQARQDLVLSPACVALTLGGPALSERRQACCSIPLTSCATREAQTDQTKGGVRHLRKIRPVHDVQGYGKWRSVFHLRRDREMSALSGHRPQEGREVALLSRHGEYSDREDTMDTKTNLPTEVLHSENHSKLSAEQIAKAVARHNRDHAGGPKGAPSDKGAPVSKGASVKTKRAPKS